MRKIEITKREEIVDDESKGATYEIRLEKKTQMVDGEFYTIREESIVLYPAELESLYSEIGKKLGKD